MAGAETPSLYVYLQQAQRFLRDQAQTWINPDDMIQYVNRARREVAMRTQSIRILTPVSGAITSITVKNPGQDYVNPQVIIDPPDMASGELPYPGGVQARASAQQIGGRISNVSVDFGGEGYFQPRVRIVDAVGEGAAQHVHQWDAVTSWDQPDASWDQTVTTGPLEGVGYGAEIEVHTVPLTVTQQWQEVYPFSKIPLDRYPGVAEIFAIRSVSFIYANYRYSVPVYSFSWYQAYVRTYPHLYLYVPTAATQFGQGTNGSLYLYPVPSGEYQIEIDVYCLPQDMQDDQDFEAIPKPWVDAVPYFAAHLAYLELQNLNAAEYYLKLYDSMVNRYSAYARPGRPTNPYGRGFAFT